VRVANKLKFMSLAAVVAVTALTLFQNCSPHGTASANAGSDKGLRDNGTGYSGKTFINHVVQTLCTDGTDIQARIVASSDSQGILNRENCQDIPGRRVDLTQGGNFTQVPTSGGPRSLVFDQHVFDEAGAPLTSYLCHIETMTSGNVVRVTDVTIRSYQGEYDAYVASDTPASPPQPPNYVDAKLNGVTKITGLSVGLAEFKGNYSDASITQNFSLNIDMGNGGVSSLDYNETRTGADPVSVAETGMNCYTP
jgi:hypothetical protein